MSSDIGLVRPETLRFQVENALRQAIINGRFVPGERLIERELCETLGVSRTSIREALRKLEAEKLVDIVPHKGPIVATISVKEATDLYALRGLLEGFVAREFSQCASDADIAKFGAAAQALRKAGLAQDQASVLQAKNALYGIMLERCGNELVKEALTSLHSRVNLLRATSLMHPDRLPHSLQEIDSLYQAIKARDGDGAEKAARLHVANAQTVALQMLSKAES
ncbi:GntR family transcriptional regulator [Rouxiella silvae]|uniref:GntR family transcriptional regulator n=1 Tax=Rouxiella silvae TaxID=1646373 RepID=A0AA40X4Z8_9GAMM|nr:MULTISPECIES: GntR family transcriptional regulator [Rouxiella]KAB7894836.1 FCD domain-containing protein [Rouxiella sp. S1S-2]KQN48231.1 GntR family transcriptional regulator [Serratia sp. Leaf50]MBF6638449.1 GntR family transcriptional regulator [Rouxiella silvae]ORJ20160.1 GntR family transcriptional regulator [Rouxiella silvae]